MSIDIRSQIGIDNPNPDSLSVLDLGSTDKGLLIPRLTTGERLSLGLKTPQESMLVYDRDKKAFYYYKSDKWYSLNGWTVKTEDNSGKDMVLDTTLSDAVGIFADPYEDEKLAVGGNVRVDGVVSTQKFSSDGTAGKSGPIPKGGIIMWSGTEIPEGWALCNGQTVDGVTTPDLRNRFIVGSGGDYNIGNEGGKVSVALSVSEIPAHNHNVSVNHGGAHSHSIYVHKDIGGSAAADVLGASHTMPDFNVHTNPSGGHTHTVSQSTVGSSMAHENRPPYYALAFIMKL